jgi:hypothetical protein
LIIAAPAPVARSLVGRGRSFLPARAISVDEHEQEAAERHAIKEIDTPKQVHQEGNRQNSGDDGESGDQQLVGGGVTATFHSVADGEHIMA